MTYEEIRDALAPVFSTFCDISKIDWQQYVLVLAHVNPGDFDGALTEIRQSHAFHNAPLPADVLNACNRAKQRRLSGQPSPTRILAKPEEGEWKTITLPGIGSLRVHVLPDDHPALLRACQDCQDSGWREVPTDGSQQMTVTRCHCWKANPVLQRERERSARYVKERGER